MKAILKIKNSSHLIRYEGKSIILVIGSTDDAWSVKVDNDVRIFFSKEVFEYLQYID